MHVLCPDTDGVDVGNGGHDHRDGEEIWMKEREGERAPSEKCELLQLNLS